MLGSRRGTPDDTSDDRQVHLVLPSDRPSGDGVHETVPGAGGRSGETHLVFHDEGLGSDSAVTADAEGVEILRSRRGGPHS